MLWIFLALLGAITNAGYFIIIKRSIASLDPIILTGIGFTFGGLILFTVSAIRTFPVIGEDLLSGCDNRGPEYYQSLAYL
jgi:drug/metabolite transporter (DMT)-like permease